MVASIRSRLISIGNSQGFRVPKPLLEQAGIAGDVEIGVRDGRIVIQSARKAREGWDEAFALMAANGDDRLLDSHDGSLSDWDETEWEW
ncbi:AbrB/MazE/SpoVT family DNA-binding domain-containing protein [Synechococcus sp. PCC 7336]|uniref:AbrB/MazE/SpoVT family DNA-binding domain-containing protein n=1 Tax=Synechococcus sp. PCC 7336 TaxID=195250 RepID=UPI00034B9959|nr:AbrB/MazE/SpoVT family DNA-binding domain-containing protein [Synechococcus sp. PCC 7336]